MCRPDAAASLKVLTIPIYGRSTISTDKHSARRDRAVVCRLVEPVMVMIMFNNLNVAREAKNLEKFSKQVQSIRR